MDKGVHGARFFGTHVSLNLKTFDLGSHLAAEGRGVKPGDQANARLTSQQIRPSSVDRVSNGTDTT
jgi:hypothetical protein